jgi:hypothetical protein
MGVSLDELSDANQDMVKFKVVDIITGTVDTLNKDQLMDIFDTITMVYRAPVANSGWTSATVSDLWVDSKKPFDSGAPSYLYVPPLLELKEAQRRAGKEGLQATGETDANAEKVEIKLENIFYC